MNTMIFYAYFLMNMANQINCRVVDETEANAFKTLFNNLIFWFVVAAEMGVTHFMLLLGKTNFGTAVLGLTTMTWVQYSVCWLCGLLSFPLFVLTKKAIPMKPFESLMLKADLEQEDAASVAALACVKRLLQSALRSEAPEQPRPSDGTPAE